MRITIGRGATDNMIRHSLVQLPDYRFRPCSQPTNQTVHHPCVKLGKLEISITESEAET